MSINPTRRVLWLPAWSWILLATILVGLAWQLPPPTTLSEPAFVARIAARDARVFCTRQDGKFRVIPDEEKRDVAPVWVVSRWTRAEQFTSLRHFAALPGFYHQSAKWEYGLFAHPFGRHWEPQEADRLTWKETEELRPLVISELNSRFPEERLGDRLQRVLNDGAERESWLSIQNGVIALAWVSLPMALWALIAMCFQRASLSGGTDTGHQPADRA